MYGKHAKSTKEAIYVRRGPIVGNALALAILVSTIGGMGTVRAQDTQQEYGPVIQGSVTHFGSDYNGRGMSCGGTYYSADPSIAAVAWRPGNAWPSRDAEWPCRTQLEVAGPAGTIVITRTDSCGACSRNQLDLSEAGIMRVCGSYGVCSVSIREIH